MGKHTSLGWAKPSDRIYKTGFVVGGKKLTDLVAGSPEESGLPSGAQHPKAGEPGTPSGTKDKPDKPE